MIWLVAWAAIGVSGPVSAGALDPRPYDPVGDTPVVARTSFDLGDVGRTPAREALAERYLRELGETVLPGLAWHIVPPEIQRNIARNEAVERSRARLVDQVWREAGEPAPFRRVQIEEIERFLAAWPELDSPADGLRGGLVARARSTPRLRADYDAFDLSRAPDDDLDGLIALRADLLARTLARARDSAPEVRRRLAVDALRIIADVHLILGANRGRRADLFHEARLINYWPTLMLWPIGGGLAAMMTEDLSLGLVGVAMLAVGAPFAAATVANVARDGRPAKEPRVFPWFARRRLERRAAARARRLFWRSTRVYAHGRYTPVEPAGPDLEDFEAHAAGIERVVHAEIRRWLDAAEPAWTCERLLRTIE